MNSLQRETLHAARDLLQHWSKPPADVRAELPPELVIAGDQLREVDGLDLLKVLVDNRSIVGHLL